MSRSPFRRALVSLCLVAAAGCTPVTTPPGDGGSPRVLGACCPATDEGIYALMRQYENTPEAARPPEVAILPYWLSSGLSERERIVIRDAVRWAALWPRIMGSHRPVRALPTVDFSREMIVVVSMGVRPTGGYAIMIDSVSVVRGRLFVFVREQSPGRSCFTTQALTHPVALARLERTQLPVSFVTHSVTREC